MCCALRIFVVQFGFYDYAKVNTLSTNHPDSTPYPPTESKPSSQLDSPTTDEISFERLIGTSVIIRLVVDTGSKFFNPFLPIIAAGLSVDAVAIGRLVALRNMVGLVSPVLGTLADRYGFRLIMRASLLIASLGAVLTGRSSSFAGAALGMAIWGIGLAGFSPTLQAYVSSKLPNTKRARGIGMLEYSWALASIVGLFAVGYLIEFVNSLGYAGWRAPFFVIAAGMIAGAFAMRAFPSGKIQSGPVRAETNANRPDAASRIDRERIKRFFWLGANACSTYAAIVGIALFYFAAVQLVITYGLWLQSEYGLLAKQLGRVALILGIADLIGSVLVSLVTDRLGKRRSVLYGTLGMIIGLLCMPMLNRGVVIAIVGLFVTRGCFEFAIVSAIPLLSEQTPEQRGKVMTLGAAVKLLAATFASVTGPLLYERLGVIGVTYISALFAILALYIVWRFVEEA